MAFENLDIQRDIEPIRERIGDGLVGRDRLIFVSGANSNPRRVPVCGRVNVLVVAVFSLRVRPPKVEVAKINVAVGDGQHLVPRNLDLGHLHDGAAKVLDQGPVRIGALKGDLES